MLVKVDQFKDVLSKKWIWIVDAAREYDIPLTTLKGWTKYHCPWIGRRVDRKKQEIASEKNPIRSKYERIYVLVSDMEDIRKARLSGIKPRVVPSDPDIIPTNEAVKYPGVTKGRLVRARREKASWHLGGKEPWSDLVPTALADGRVRKLRSWRRSQAEKMGQSDPVNYKPHLDGKDVWLPSPLAVRRYGIKEEALRKAADRGEIRREWFPCPSIQNTGRAKAKEVAHYHEDDVIKYSAKLARPSKKGLAATLLKELLAKGPVPFRTILVQAREIGISERALRRAKAALKIHDSQPGGIGPSYWYFEGAELPAGAARSTPGLSRAVQFFIQHGNGAATVSPALLTLARQSGVSVGSLYRAHEAIKSGRVPGPTSVSVDSPGTQSEEEAREATSRNRAETTEYPGHTKRPYRTGRPPTKEPFYKFAYDHRRAGKTRAEVFGALDSHFGPSACPSSPVGIKDYVKRWSESFEPPLPMPE